MPIKINSAIRLSSLILALAQARLHAGGGLPEILLTPVNPPGNIAPYPPGVVIDGQTIKVPQGGIRIWLDVFARNWDAYCNARTIQAKINATQGFSGSNAVPPSSTDLAYAVEPCGNVGVCRTALSGLAAGCGFGEPAICSGGFCAANFINKCRDDFFLLGEAGTCAIDTSSIDVRLGCTADLPGIPPLEYPAYFGTIVLDIPLGARGRYDIPLAPEGTFIGGLNLPLCDYFLIILTGAAVLVGEDCNNNVVLDELDIDQGTSQDVNSNGIPDECETDCQPNGVPDDFDISSGAVADCNVNAIPDDCEAANCVAAACRDCNANGTLDGCDIAYGGQHDIDGDGVPDSCEGIIPAVSTWGLAVLALLLLIAAKTRFSLHLHKKTA